MSPRATGLSSDRFPSVFTREMLAGMLGLRSSVKGVLGVTFLGGVDVIVDAPAGGPPGQRIGFAPELLDFGRVDVGVASRKTLRISNFGFSELEVSNVTSTLPDFTSFFKASHFVVPPPTGCGRKARYAGRSKFAQTLSTLIQ